MERVPTFIKRIGWVAFFFFLLKGLVWLAVAFGVGKLFFK